MREISIENFKKWFPKNTEDVLVNFILSKDKIMTVMFSDRGSVVISKEHAERLLKELREET